MINSDEKSRNLTPICIHFNRNYLWYYDATMSDANKATLPQQKAHNFEQLFTKCPQLTSTEIPAESNRGSNQLRIPMPPVQVLDKKLMRPRFKHHPIANTVKYLPRLQGAIFSLEKVRK